MGQREFLWQKESEAVRRETEATKAELLQQCSVVRSEAKVRVLICVLICAYVSLYVSLYVRQKLPKPSSCSNFLLSAVRPR